MTGNGGAILLYHRVAEPATDPQLLCVSPTRFAQQLEVIRRTATPVALGDMLRLARRNELPERAVAVTFDDGYADNLLAAKPALERAGVPATVFATTGHTGTLREFFWDELDRIMLQGDTLPPTLELLIGGRTHRFDIDAPSQADADRRWDVTVADAPTARHRAYRDLCGLLHRATVDDRAAALGQLRAWAGTADAGRATRRMMSADELRELAAEGLVSVGGHTANHPSLAVEQVDVQRREVTENRTALREIIGAEPAGFAYPFGTRHDYTADTVEAVRRAGFGYACSNYNGLVSRASDPYQLPRFIVRDWDGPTFERRLEQFFRWQPRPRLGQGCR